MKKLIIILAFFPIVLFGQIRDTIITIDPKFEIVKSRVEQLKNRLIDIRTKEVIAGKETNPLVVKSLLADLDVFLIKYEKAFSAAYIFDVHTDSLSIVKKLSELKLEKIRLKKSESIDTLYVSSEIKKINKQINKQNMYLQQITNK